MCNFPHSCKENRTPSTARNGHVTITLGLASGVNNPCDCHARGRIGGIVCKNAHTHTYSVFPRTGRFLPQNEPKVERTLYAGEEGGGC